MTTIFDAGGFGLGLFDAPDNVLVFDDLTTYYINLLIIQYFTKFRARQTVGSFVKESVADHIEEAVRDGFNLDTAVGAQLDTLAAYRGAQRTVFGLNLTRQYFHMPFYDDVDPTTGKGFAEYGDTVDWFFLLYADANQPSYAMNDDELRRLTKFLGKTQSRFLSLKELDDILFEFFGNNVQLADNENMTITYTHSLGDPDTLFTIVDQTHNLPHGAGVRVIVV